MSGEHIVVLGAGTGGLVAANLLAHKGYRVTLVERSDTHLFQPGMLWIAFRGHNPSRYLRPVEELVDPSVNLVRGTVEAVNLHDRTVKLVDGRTLEYDRLIVALGVSLDWEAIEGLPEAREKYGDFYSGAGQAERLWESFSRMREGTLLVAVSDPLYKCPPAPHKAAFLASLTVMEKGLQGKVRVALAVPYSHAYPATSFSPLVEEKLEEAGVEVYTFFTLDRIDVEAGKAYSLEGEEVEFNVAAVIPPNRGPAITIEPGEAVDEDGFIKVDKETLEISGYDDAYAIGDCNNAPTSKSGVTAHLEAEVVVDRIEGWDARFNGRTNCPVVTDGEASFVITDYAHQAVPVRFTRFKRLLEELFIEAYWSSLRYPWRWKPVFHAYFQATMPGTLGGRGW